MTLDQFAPFITQIGYSIPATLHSVAQLVSNEVLREEIEATPVDTGEARSNWVVGIDGIPVGIQAAYNQYPKDSKGSGAARAESANAQLTLAVGEIEILSSRPGQVIYVVNNSDHNGQNYLDLMDEGLAPIDTIQNQRKGFVEEAVNTALSKVDQVTIELVP